MLRNKRVVTMRDVRKVILHHSDCLNEKPTTFHFMIGYKGEIIKGFMLNQKCFHCDNQNEDSVSILVRGDGHMNLRQATSLRMLNLELFDLFNLGNDQVFEHRHFDCQSYCTIENFNDGLPL